MAKDAVHAILDGGSETSEDASKAVKAPEEEAEVDPLKDNQAFEEAVQEAKKEEVKKEKAQEKKQAEAAKQGGGSATSVEALEAAKAEAKKDVDPCADLEDKDFSNCKTQSKDCKSAWTICNAASKTEEDRATCETDHN